MCNNQRRLFPRTYGVRSTGNLECQVYYPPVDVNVMTLTEARRDGTSFGHSHTL